MQKLFKIPLVFLVVASLIGLLLRWYFVSPMSWLKYTYWLHAHSHIMFLGWVFNTILVGYITNYKHTSTKYKILFIIIQVLLVGMLISFPLQGYGAISITLSVLHTITIYIFTFWMLHDCRSNQSASVWHLKVSLILFIISSLGPFAVAALKANGLGQSTWYHLAVYYYLHFQYNGVFVFGLLSLFYQLLEEKEINLDLLLIKKSGWCLLISLFPTYFLSALWTNPPLIFNAIGLVGALTQIVSLFYFMKMILVHNITLNQKTKVLMTFSLTAFIIKSLLQLISFHPTIAILAFEIRPFIIAYLHLVLIGVVTLFLLAWYIEKGWIIIKSNFPLAMLITGFIGSELIMIISGLPNLNKHLLTACTSLLFLFSVCLVIAFVNLTNRAINK